MICEYRFLCLQRNAQFADSRSLTVATAILAVKHGTRCPQAPDPDLIRHCAAFGVLLFQQFWSGCSQVQTISFSQFEALLDQNKVGESRLVCRIVSSLLSLAAKAVR